MHDWLVCTGNASFLPISVLAIILWIVTHLKLLSFIFHNNIVSHHTQSHVSRTLARSSCLSPCRDLSACRPWATSSSAWTSIYCDAASRWAHIAIVCFIHFRCMLHVFHLDIVKVDRVLYMLQWLYTYVVGVCFKYFRCFKRVLQVFF